MSRVRVSSPRLMELGGLRTARHTCLPPRQQHPSVSTHRRAGPSKDPKEPLRKGRGDCHLVRVRGGPSEKGGDSSMPSPGGCTRMQMEAGAPHAQVSL